MKYTFSLSCNYFNKSSLVVVYVALIVYCINVSTLIFRPTNVVLDSYMLIFD